MCAILQLRLRQRSGLSSLPAVSPECSPEVRHGSDSSTVSRGLRLIAECGLEDDGVEGLAERLGLARATASFVRSAPGSNSEYGAHTRRLQFAKKLIDETVLPMNQVAIALVARPAINATIFRPIVELQLRFASGTRKDLQPEINMFSVTISSSHITGRDAEFWRSGVRPG